jgi:hypothetical protein
VPGILSPGKVTVKCARYAPVLRMAQAPHLTAPFPGKTSAAIGWTGQTEPARPRVCARQAAIDRQLPVTRRATYGPDTAMISGYLRSIRDRRTLVISTYVIARQVDWVSTDLPSWSCGFDSRRPLRESPDFIDHFELMFLGRQSEGDY